MNCLAVRSMVMVVVLLATAQAWAEQPKADPADEKALHELHRAFLAAFNKGDVEAVAALHTSDMDFLGFDGQTSKGRVELEKRIASRFAKSEGAKPNSPFGSLRFLTPDVAIADRPSALTPAPEGGPGKVHATVVYVKRDGKWLIAAVRLMVPFQPSR
jgi:uncharacterized protein (TIGR02246 family)